MKLFINYKLIIIIFFLYIKININNNLNESLKEKIDKIINKNKKQYFNNNIKFNISYVGEREHLYRYIIDYYNKLYSSRKYEELCKDLFEYIEYYYADEYFIFMDDVFKDYSEIEISRKFDSKSICKKIINKLPYIALENRFMKLGGMYYSDLKIIY